MFSQQLAKFKIETKIKTSLRARGPPGVSGALSSLRILRIGRIGSVYIYIYMYVTVTKTITTRANQKPWMTAEVRGLLKTRDDAFRSGDKAVLKTARANLSWGIKKAKRLYAQKINNHFTDSKDTRSLWQAIQTITDYKPLPQVCDDTSLPDALN